MHNKKKHIVITLLLLSVVLIYGGLRAVTYFSDRFYYSEYKKVTLRNIPQSADILYKGVSSKRFNGDYCSACVIRLSEQDYRNVFTELSNDRGIIQNEDLRIIGSEQLTQVMQKVKNEKLIYSFKREAPGEDDLYLYIGFLSDQKSIVISICRT